MAVFSNIWSNCVIISIIIFIATLEFLLVAFKTENGFMGAFIYSVFLNGTNETDSTFASILDNSSDPNASDWNKIEKEAGNGTVLNGTWKAQIGNGTDFIGTWNSPIILIWTSYFGGIWKDVANIFVGCPKELNCEITFDRNRLNESSAVLFHIRDHSWTDIPTERNPDQYYIFALFESPINTYMKFSESNRNTFFNLTTTYRTDSDSYWPYYGRFVRSTFRSAQKIDQLDSHGLLRIAKGKSKLVAWFVSNCHSNSGRERVVKELKKYIGVDVFGKCGKLKCERGKKGWESGVHDAGNCNKILTKKYKFYLTLENSLCKDYVTEKFYFTLDNSIVLPVVMERQLFLNSIGNEEMAKDINRAFIAVDDFKNIPDLVKYLKYLNGNITAYMEYFEWRKKYYIDLSANNCELCRVVKEGKRHIIDDISDWWFGKAKCHSWKRTR